MGERAVARLVARVVRNAKLWTIVVALDPDGWVRIICTKNASLSQQAAIGLAIHGVKHWRIWFREETEAKLVWRMAKKERKEPYNTQDEAINTVLAAAKQLEFEYRFDDAVRTEAVKAIEEVESTLKGRVKDHYERVLIVSNLAPQKFVQAIFP